MGTQKDSRTLVLVCRRAFSRIVERVLHREGFNDFQRGGLSLVGGATTGARTGNSASEVFVLMTDVGSARRLVDHLRACPIRGDAENFFEVYTIGD
jgi:hypothetical protein